MRGIRSFKRSTKGLGGFTEAVLALMVVTLSVILLSAAFSLTSIEVLKDGDEASLSDRCDDIWICLVEDKMLWNGEAIVISSFDSRASAPYAILEGLFGYELSLTDISDDNSSSIRMFIGIEVEDADVHVEKHPVLVMNELGEMHAGLIEIRVW